jgi:hypothetical protein
MILPSLIEGWISHFWSADHSMQWLHAEHPIWFPLSPDTILVGVVDAIGINAEDKTFFGEWKTANPREKNTWKQLWRKNPQSLTYGVLVRSIYPGCHDFTVRKAFKPTSFKGKLSEPSYDHAWYTYSDAELDHWTLELLKIAHEIREYRTLLDPWPTNFRSCFDYGLTYVCPFFAEGCDKHDWGFVPATALRMDGRLKTLPPDARPWASNLLPSAASNHLVVLSASSVDTWLRCRERYRKHYEVGIDTESNDAAKLGTAIHSALGKHYRTMIVPK